MTHSHDAASNYTSPINVMIDLYGVLFGLFRQLYGTKRHFAYGQRASFVLVIVQVMLGCSQHLAIPTRLNFAP